MSTTEKIITTDEGDEVCRVRITSTSCLEGMAVYVKCCVYKLCSVCKTENDVNNTNCNNCNLQL